MTDIKQLAGQLPLNRLAPALRARLESVLEGGEERQDGWPIAREAVAAFLKSGDLVKVALAGQSDSRHALFLVRGTSRLVDLTGLLPQMQRDRHGEVEGPPAPGEQSAQAEDAPAPPAAAPVQAGHSPFEEASHVQGRDSSSSETAQPPALLLEMLEAMEQAQRFPVGDPRSNDPCMVVDRIIRMLRGLAPGITLHAQLHGLSAVGEDTRYVIPVDEESEKPFWQKQRRPGQTMLIHDPEELPAVLRRQLEADGTRSSLIVVEPLPSPSDPQAEIGLLFAAAGPGWSGQMVRELARRLAAFVASRWRCQQDVNRRVLTDSLTGIHNRAFFDSQFPLELERAARAGLPLTLVLGDLDNFKAINDAHGHQCGDIVLQAVARRLQTALRRIDHICRIGGEEFACLLPSTSSVEAREVLSRLVGLPFRVRMPAALGGAELSVTMSYGTVTFPDAGSNHGELHRKADSMLYRAKRLGRNRCCLWRPDGRHQLILPLSPPPAGG